MLGLMRLPARSRKSIRISRISGTSLRSFGKSGEIEESYERSSLYNGHRLVSTVGCRVRVHPPGRPAVEMDSVLHGPLCGARATASNRDGAPLQCRATRIRSVVPLHSRAA